MHEHPTDPGLLMAFLVETWRITLELAPPLLLGLLLAGLAHVYLPKRWIQSQLSRPTLGSVMRAVLLGVPMPLCSCGVVPTAIALRRQGASQGAATAFLISTPQTGVDSILVSASFLGWPFAIFKVVAAAVTGIVGGALVNGLDRASPAADAQIDVAEEPASRTLVEAVRYAVFDLLAVIDRWIVLGVVLAAVITIAIPADFFADNQLTGGLLGMLMVLAVALPLYICTTSSVPIAASLIAAGMPLGSALVFLMAGPATNLATLGAVYRGLGGRVLAVYLGTVIVMSVGLGMTFDFVLAGAAAPAVAHAHGTDGLALASAILLIGLLLLLTVRRVVLRLRRPAASLDAAGAGLGVTLAVEGMTCQHCVGRVKKTLEDIDGVDEAEPNLAAGRVWIRGANLDAAALAEAVRRAGYGANETPAEAEPAAKGGGA